MKRKIISIIIPVFNEQENLEMLVLKLNRTIETIKNYNFQYIFIDDGSIDNTSLVIEKLTKKFKNIFQIQLSRNFGKESAVTCGIFEAKSDAAIILDADLQHQKYLNL